MDIKPDKFIITCKVCGSPNCRIETLTNYEYVETNIICDDCGEVE